MKKDEDGNWIYKNFTVYLAEHPKLKGKYEIYKGEDFVSRAYNLSDAKGMINNAILAQNIRLTI